MDSIGLSCRLLLLTERETVWQFAFTGKRRVIDPPFSGLVTGLPKAPPEIARTCHLSFFEREDTDGPA